MKSLNKSSFARIASQLATVAASAIFTFIAGREAMAAVEWNHLFNYSSFYITTGSAGSMATYMGNAASNYDSATDLVQGGSNGPIVGYEGNYGAIFWQGLTQPFNSSSQSCIIWPTAATNANCNKTTNKAVSANLYFNTAYPFSDRNWLARHEMGHVFGLNHPACSGTPASVMKVPSCTPLATTLQADEISWINGKY